MQRNSVIPHTSVTYFNILYVHGTDWFLFPTWQKSAIKMLQSHIFLVFFLLLFLLRKTPTRILYAFLHLIVRIHIIRRLIVDFRCFARKKIQSNEEAEQYIVLYFAFSLSLYLCLLFLSFTHTSRSIFFTLSLTTLCHMHKK